MGTDYSGCFGSDRNKLSNENSYKGILPVMMDTWQHSSRANKVMVTHEEAYMVKKQVQLQIHFIPCTKLKE